MSSDTENGSGKTGLTLPRISVCSIQRQLAWLEAAPGRAFCFDVR